MAENVKRKKKKRAVLIVFMALVLAVLAVVCVYETELNKLDSNDGVDNSFYDSQYGIILMRERDLKIITSTVSELTPNIQPKIWSMISKVLFSNIARIIF